MARRPHNPFFVRVDLISGCSCALFSPYALLLALPIVPWRNSAFFSVFLCPVAVVLRILCAAVPAIWTYRSSLISTFPEWLSRPGVFLSYGFRWPLCSGHASPSRRHCNRPVSSSSSSFQFLSCLVACCQLCVALTVIYYRAVSNICSPE